MLGQETYVTSFGIVDEDVPGGNFKTKVNDAGIIGDDLKGDLCKPASFKQGIKQSTPRSTSSIPSKCCLMAEKGYDAGVALRRLRTGDVTDEAREMHTATQAQVNLQQMPMDDAVARVPRTWWPQQPLVQFIRSVGY